MASEQARELRRQGIAAAKAGDKDRARQLLQQSLRLEPTSEAAWLWLVSVAREQREKLFYLHKLLEINPNNDMALQSLQSLGISRDELARQVAAGAAQTPAPASAPVAPARPAAPPPSTPQAPGVPVPDPQRITQAQAEAESIVRQYLGSPEGYPGITWVAKNRGRAGERDSLVLRTYIAGGCAGALVILLIVGYLIVWNTPALRGVVFAPTWTPSRTPIPPTLTFTPTAGVTPTPSPTPELTLTPSPTVPPEIPNAAVVPPQPTPIYPSVIEKGVRDSIGLMDAGLYDVALPTLEVEITRVANQFDPQPYYYTAMALAAQGELEDAAQILQDAEARLPEQPNENYQPLVDSGLAYIDLLRAQEAQGEGDRSRFDSLLANAEDRALAAIEGDPRLELPYLTLAERYLLERDPDRAVGVLDRGLAVPELAANVKLIVKKGEIFYGQGEYDLAAYQAFLALYIQPDTEPAHLLQIRTAMAQGDPGLAVLYSQAYLFYYPGSAEGYRLLGDARVEEGNIPLALEAYNQALAGGDNADLLLARATLYNQQRRYDQARDDLTRAFNLTDDPAIRAQRMIAAYNAGNLSTAESDAEALLGSGAIPDGEIEFIQARILIDEARAGDSDDYETALSLLNDVLDEIAPEQRPVAEEYRARALYNLEQYGDALNAINRAMDAAETGSRHYLRGLILEARGETDEALREYDWVLTLGEVFPYPFLPDTRERAERLQEE